MLQIKGLLSILAIFVLVKSIENRRNLWVPPISEISAETLNQDTSLDYNQIQITGLQGNLSFSFFTQLKSLNELRIIRNQIREIEPGALCSTGNLRILEIDFSGNKNPPVLTKQMFHGCSKLEDLFLKFDYNDPSTMDPNALENLGGLRSLGVDSLKIPRLENNFLVVPKNITSLVLSNIHLTAVEKDVFEDLTKLEELEIVHNIGLKSIPVGVFSKLKKLKRLNLKDNAMNYMSWDEFKGLESLEELNVADNQIGSFDVDKIVKNLPKLKKLSIEMNAVKYKEQKKLMRQLEEKFSHSVEVNIDENDFY